MNRGATLDPSRQLDLYLRQNRINTKSFDAVDAAGSPYSLIYEDFQVIVKTYAGNYKNLILLGIGTGITLSETSIVITFTAEQSDIDPGEYYWELYKNDDGQTWISGKLIVHNGVFDGVIDDPNTLQVIEDSAVQIVINC